MADFGNPFGEHILELRVEMMIIEAKQSRCERMVFTGMALLLLFAPLAFGSVHVWSYSTVVVGVFLLTALYYMDRLVFSHERNIEWVSTPVNWVFLSFFIIIGLQVLPIPMSWLAFISPTTAVDKTELFSILSRIGHKIPSWTYLAYYRHPLILEGLKSAASIAMFFLVLNTVKSKRYLNILMYVLIGVGLFESVYAIHQVYSETPRVWWLESRAGGRWASGTYIVSNHFAAYLEMMIPLTLGFMVAQQHQTKQATSGLGGVRSMIQKTVGWFSPENANPKMFFLFFSAIVMGVGLLLSGSRGGIVSLGAALFLMSVLFLTKSRYRKFGLLMLCFCLIALGFGSHLGVDPTFEKFEHTEKGYHGRVSTYRSMLPMLKHYPILGVGWGNFRYLYPRYVPKDYDGVSSSGHAHNDWLEAGAELGLLGGGLIFMAFGIFLFKMVCIWLKRKDSFAVGVGIGTIGGLLAMGFHSLFDLNMHIQANPLTLAAISGIGYITLHRERRGIRERFLYGVRVIPLTWFRRILLTFMVVGVSGALMWAATQHYLAEAKCPTEWNSTLNLNWNPLLSEIRTAISRNPGNAEYYWKQAWHYMKAPVKEEEESLRRENHEAVIRSLVACVRLNPSRGDYWYYLGKWYSMRSYDPQWYLTRWLPLADTCFAVASRYAPRDSTILFDIAWYWVWRSSLFPEVHPNSSKKINVDNRRKDGIRKFQNLFQRALELNPDRWKEAVDRVREYYPDDAIIYGIAPSKDEILKSRVLKSLVDKGPEINKAASRLH